MANEYLYKSRDALGNVIYTASKEDTDGKPVTRVEFKEPQSMVLTGSIVTDVTLQNAVSAAGNGTALVVGNIKTVTVEITGTSTSRTIIFEGSSVGGTYYPIMGVKLSDLSLASHTTGKDEVWQFDVTGLVNFRTRVSAVSGGNVSVKGKAVV